MELRVTQKHCHKLNMKSSPLVNGRKPYIIISGKNMERTSNGSLRPFYDASRANTVFFVISLPMGPASTPHLASPTPSIVALPEITYTAGSTSSVFAAVVTPLVVTPSTRSHLAASSLFAAAVPSSSVMSLSLAAVYTAAESAPDLKLTTQPTANQQKYVQSGKQRAS